MALERGLRVNTPLEPERRTGWIGIDFDGVRPHLPRAHRAARVSRLPPGLRNSRQPALLYHRRRDRRILRGTRPACAETAVAATGSDHVIVDHRNVGAAFRRLSLPVAAQLLGDQILGIVDTIAIGSLGAVALAGATAASAILTAVLFAIFGLLTGTSIIAAQRIGVTRRGRLCAHGARGRHRSVRVGVAASPRASFSAARPSTRWSATLPSADASATLPHPALRVGAADRDLGLRSSSGWARRETGIVGVLVLVAINLVHIPLLLMLGLGWWTHHPLGIAGAGLSSLLSETFGAICAVAYVESQTRVPRLRQLEDFVADGARMHAARFAGSRSSSPASCCPTSSSSRCSHRSVRWSSRRSGRSTSSPISRSSCPSPLQSAAQIVIGQRLGAARRRGRALVLRTRAAHRYADRHGSHRRSSRPHSAWPLAYIFTLERRRRRSWPRCRSRCTW